MSTIFFWQLNLLYSKDRRATSFTTKEINLATSWFFPLSSALFPELIVFACADFDYVRLQGICWKSQRAGREGVVYISHVIPFFKKSVPDNHNKMILRLIRIHEVNKSMKKQKIYEIVYILFDCEVISFACVLFDPLRMRIRKESWNMFTKMRAL